MPYTIRKGYTMEYTIQDERREVESALAKERARNRYRLRVEIAKIERSRSKLERALKLPLRRKMRNKILYELENLDARESDLITELLAL